MEPRRKRSYRYHEISCNKLNDCNQKKGKETPYRKGMILVIFVNFSLSFFVALSNN